MNRRLTTLATIVSPRMVIAAHPLMVWQPNGQRAVANALSR